MQHPPANAAAAPTAAEREAMDKLRPSGWDGKTYYSLTDLRQRKTPTIDMKNREQYLAPDEFRSAFGMTKRTRGSDPPLPPAAFQASSLKAGCSFACASSTLAPAPMSSQSGGWLSPLR